MSVCDENTTAVAENAEKMLDGFADVCVPFYANNTNGFACKLSQNPLWESDTLPEKHFYLQYMQRIFSSDTKKRNCIVCRKKQFGFISEIRTSNCNYKFIFDEAKIFYFDTGIGIVVLKIKSLLPSLSQFTDVSLHMRKTDNRFTDEDGTETSVGKFAKKLVDSVGLSVTMFEHMPEGSALRADIFSGIIVDSSTDNHQNAELCAYRIAMGFDFNYPADKSVEEHDFYSPFEYIKWCITSRGVCAAAYLTGQDKDDSFIKNKWLDNVGSSYILTYIVVLHQKYAMYHYINVIASESNASDFKKYQKLLTMFNTKYIFSVISEETFYQNVYKRMKHAHSIDEIFHDLDDTLARIAGFSEFENDKVSSSVMMGISLLCAFSVVKDTYDLVTQPGGIFALLSGADMVGHLLLIIEIIFILIAVILVNLNKIKSWICRLTNHFRR